MMRRSLSIVGAFLLALGVATSAQAVDFSFTGAFTEDDDVQFFDFSVGAQSLVTLRAWSYAGGTNAAGTVIPRGGFDTILALFDAGTGLLIDQNDDGGCGNVAADALTGRCWDTFFQSTLNPGNYRVSIMEFDNFANGPNVSNGFSRQGQGNFTLALTGATECVAGRFIDVSGVQGGRCRQAHWAFDILNVETATTVVPEPATLLLLASGLAGLAGTARRMRRKS